MVVYVVSSGERGEGASPKAVFRKVSAAEKHVLATWPDAYCVESEDSGRQRWDINVVDRVYIEPFQVK